MFINNTGVKIPVIVAAKSKGSKVPKFISKNKDKQKIKNNQKALFLIFQRQIISIIQESENDQIPSIRLNLIKTKNIKKIKNLVIATSY